MKIIAFNTWKSGEHKVICENIKKSSHALRLMKGMLASPEVHIAWHLAIVPDSFIKFEIIEDKTKVYDDDHYGKSRGIAPAVEEPGEAA